MHIAIISEINKANIPDDNALASQIHKQKKSEAIKLRILKILT